MSLYVLIITCGTLFMHRHKLDSGRVVIHIHPYSLSSDPTDNSNHESEKEIITLDITYFQSYFNSSILLIGDPLERVLEVQHKDLILPQVLLESQRLFSLRGPPAHILS